MIVCDSMIDHYSFCLDAVTGFSWRTSMCSSLPTTTDRYLHVYLSLMIMCDSVIDHYSFCLYAVTGFSWRMSMCLFLPITTDRYLYVCLSLMIMCDSVIDHYFFCLDTITGFSWKTSVFFSLPTILWWYILISRFWFFFSFMYHFSMNEISCDKKKLMNLYSNFYTKWQIDQVKHFEKQKKKTWSSW